MKRINMFVIAVIACGCLAAAAQEAKDHKSAPTNPQFEMLKKLAGSWTGKGQHGDEGMDMTVTYKVTSAGSTVMETLFEGTGHEMITMYCMDGKDLVLTHYCAMGNQPHMKLAKPSSADPNVMTFECDGHGGNMKESDAHMHKAVITIVDNDHIKSVWSMLTDKKPGDEARFELTRKNS